MRIESLGDSALIVRDLPGPAYAYADALLVANISGILDICASYDTLGVYGAPGDVPANDLLATLQGLKIEGVERRGHQIPACYELGDDLHTITQNLGLSVEELVDLHSGREFECFAVGFCPGFPYLGWLPDRLQGVPRMQTPRIRTEPGSIGITGKQTGVYSLPTPGGWPIIARTPLTLVDMADNYFPIQAGDTVTFNRIGEAEFQRLKGKRL